MIVKDKSRGGVSKINLICVLATFFVRITV